MKTPKPTADDYALADAITQRRAADPSAQPTLEELHAIDRIIVEQTRQRLIKEGRLIPDDEPPPSVPRVSE